MEKSFQLTNVEKEKKKKKTGKLIQLTRAEYPINPHPLHWHTAVLWESGIALWSAFRCPWNGEMWSQGQQQAGIQLSVPDCASLLPTFSLSVLPLSPSAPGLGPSQFTWHSKLERVTSHCCCFSPHLPSLCFSLSPFQTPAFSRQLPTKCFLFVWQLKSVPQLLLYSSRNSFLAPNLCLLPSLSSNPHTPALLSHILSQSWIISFSFIRLSISSTFFCSIHLPSSLRHLHSSPDIYSSGSQTLRPPRIRWFSQFCSPPRARHFCINVLSYDTTSSI